MVKFDFRDLSARSLDQFMSTIAFHAHSSASNFNKSWLPPLTLCNHLRKCLLKKALAQNCLRSSHKRSSRGTYHAQSLCGKRVFFHGNHLMSETSKNKNYVVQTASALHRALLAGGRVFDVTKSLPLISTASPKVIGLSKLHIFYIFFSRCVQIFVRLYRQY